MMRVRLVGALCAMSVVSAAAAPRMLGAQSTFEGVITMHMTAQGMDQDVAYAAKGENVRMDIDLFSFLDSSDFVFTDYGFALFRLSAPGRW